jgi:hypothetical protein
MRLRARLGNVQTSVACRGDLVPAVVGRNAPAPLRTAANVLDLLEQLTAAVWADPFTRPTEKARAAGYLASVALKAIEARNLAARVEMLEAVLKLRPGGSAS